MTLSERLAIGNASTVICVIGPPRSGTSLTARLLNLAGVFLGPDDTLVPAGPPNPKGFWECQGIVDLNERLLASLGGSVRNPPKRLRSGWEKSEEVAPERHEACALLEKTFGDRALWGWKDPRACFTLPFWRLLVPNMRFVICLRNPIDIALSVEGIGVLKVSRSEVFSAWHRYTAAALAHTSGCRRILLSYSDYIERSRRTVERLWRFIGNEGAPSKQAADRLQAVIDHTMLHHQTSPADVMLDDELPPEASALYLLAELLSRAQAGDGEAVARLEEAIDSYAFRHLTLTDLSR